MQFTADGAIFFYVSLVSFSILETASKFIFQPGCGEVLEDESPDEMMRMRGAYFKMMPLNRSRLGISAAQKDIGIGFPDYGNGNGEDEAQRVLILQPFSLFFLFIYIVIIFVQFGCMCWHR